MPPCSLEEMVSAGWDLVQHLEGLQDVSVSARGLEQGLAGMEAVSEQRSRLQVRAGAAQVRLWGRLHLLDAVMLAAAGRRLEWADYMITSPPSRPGSCCFYITWPGP